MAHWRGSGGPVSVRHTCEAGDPGREGDEEAPEPLRRSGPQRSRSVLARTWLRRSDTDARVCAGPGKQGRELPGARGSESRGGGGGGGGRPAARPPGGGPGNLPPPNCSCTAGGHFLSRCVTGISNRLGGPRPPEKLRDPTHAALRGRRCSYGSPGVGSPGAPAALVLLSSGTRPHRPPSALPAVPFEPPHMLAKRRRASRRLPFPPARGVRARLSAASSNPPVAPPPGPRRPACCGDAPVCGVLPATTVSAHVGPSPGASDHSPRPHRFWASVGIQPAPPSPGGGLQTPSGGPPASGVVLRFSQQPGTSRPGKGHERKLSQRHGLKPPASARQGLQPVTVAPEDTSPPRRGGPERRADGERAPGGPGQESGEPPEYPHFLGHRSPERKRAFKPMLVRERARGTGRTPAVDATRMPANG
ncbi:collagen alpha-1(I) chain-like [Prionailurus viverrinus]|uniref:collagen alpha-1(I) chain-like n=1 Tax=Prionailurus viverrinus TaxID=61388 RepID=UPI001FF57F85|nr:collagen alpha-1(I) chain-like [Prionailurus viverrinus]